MTSDTIVKPSYELNTPIFPFDQGQGIFLEHFQLPKQYVEVDGQLLPVAILKFDTQYDLLSLSNHAALLANGRIDWSDMLDSEVSVDALYYRDEFSKDNEWKIIDVTAYSERFCFDKTTESNSRIRGLQEMIVLPITIDGEVHQVKYGIAGEVSLEYANIKIWWSAVSVLTATEGQQKDLLTRIRKQEPLRGFKLGAYRANANRASR